MGDGEESCPNVSVQQVPRPLRPEPLFLQLREKEEAGDGEGVMKGAS